VCRLAPRPPGNTRALRELALTSNGRYVPLLTVIGRTFDKRASGLQVALALGDPRERALFFLYADRVRGKPPDDARRAPNRAPLHRRP
jgi:hypothetical protein